MMGPSGSLGFGCRHIEQGCGVDGLLVEAYLEHLAVEVRRGAETVQPGKARGVEPGIVCEGRFQCIVFAGLVCNGLYGYTVDRGQVGRRELKYKVGCRRLDGSGGAQRPAVGVALAGGDGVEHMIV